VSIDLDKTLIGSEFDHTEFPPVTAGHIREYAAAALETNPRHLTADDAELVAPPTYVVSLRGRNFMPAKLLTLLNLRRGFDAGKDIEFGVPVRVGDALTATSTVHDIYEKTGRSGSMVFVVLRTQIVNQRGESVAVIDQKMMLR